MKVGDCMTRDVKTVSPDRTIKDAARLMAALDIGTLPVGDNDRLVGMVTDRDLAVRALAEGLSPDTPVSEVMSVGVLYCFEDEDVEHVSRNMGEQRVRRLPVLDRSKRLVGIVSIGDLATTHTRTETVGEALRDISQPEGRHSHTAETGAGARH